MTDNMVFHNLTLLLWAIFVSPSTDNYKLVLNSFYEYKNLSFNPFLSKRLAECRQITRRKLELTIVFYNLTLLHRHFCFSKCQIQACPLNSSYGCKNRNMIYIEFYSSRKQGQGYRNYPCSKISTASFLVTLQLVINNDHTIYSTIS